MQTEQLTFDRDLADDALWLKCATAAVRDLAATGYSFTVDDVRYLAEPFAAPRDPRAWGLLMKSEARAGTIRATEQFKRSQHATAGGRWVMVWVGVQA